MAAIRDVGAVRERLKGYVKCNMVIVGAAMRKVVHIIFGVLKSARPFDDTIAMNAA